MLGRSGFRGFPQFDSVAFRYPMQARLVSFDDFPLSAFWQEREQGYYSEKLANPFLTQIHF